MHWAELASHSVEEWLESASQLVVGWLIWPWLILIEPELSLIEFMWKIGRQEFGPQLTFDPELSRKMRRRERDKKAAPCDPRRGVKDSAKPVCTVCGSPSACFLGRFSFLMTWGWN